jgi:hypothetical protein
VGGIEKLEAAELDERNIPPRQLDFERSAVMRRQPPQGAEAGFCGSPSPTTAPSNRAF